jgi:predicted PurR-regulated permease PerM
MTNSKNIRTRIESYFSLGVLILLVGTLFIFTAPFLITLFFAAIVVTTIYPIHIFIKKKLSIAPSISALLTLFLVIIIILGPSFFVFLSIAEEAKDAYMSINEKIQELILIDYDYFSLLDNYPTIRSLAENALSDIFLVPEKIFSLAGNFVGETSKLVVSKATGIFRNIILFVLHLVVFLGATFFFIRDGEKFIHYLQSLLPLRKKYREEILTGMYRFTHSIIYGILGAAIAQAILLWIALTLVGFSHAVFWSAIGAFLALFPIGIALVWVPISIGLFVKGTLPEAIFFTAWCIGVVSLADNFVKPYVIGVKSMLHPFAIIVMLLGGFLTFGFAGAVFGPFIFMLTMTFLRIYKEEYKNNFEKK